MEIGKKLKDLRLQKDLTQEELGERTDLTKGYISQLENNLSSPSMETFFALLEVLGTTPKAFFDTGQTSQPIVYTLKDGTVFEDEEKGYKMTWLIPDSNDKELEPVMISLRANGAYKRFAPSLSETYGYILNGSIELQLGERTYQVKKGQSFYFEATESHQIRNHTQNPAKLLLVVTDSYL